MTIGQQQPALAQAIAKALPEYQVTPRPNLVEELTCYLSMLYDANRRLRLVGATDPELLARRHLGESLYLGALLPLARQRLVDVGSGAGFPGLALAIAHPELETTLVESHHRKAEFLAAVVEELHLAPRLSISPVFLERRPGGDLAEILRQADLVTVRALERMEQVPAWLGRWLGPQAQAAFWISGTMATLWRRRFAGWQWGEWRQLPGARERGIVVASQAGGP